jgi:hypothetical protein
LTGERCGLLGDGQHLAHVGQHRMRVLKLSGNELGISDDGGERDATSDLPDALETLRLTQLLLELTLLPQVADHAQDRRTAIKFDTLTTDQNRGGCAVPPQQLELRPWMTSHRLVCCSSSAA